MKKRYLLFPAFLCLFSTPLPAPYLFKNGTIVDVNDVATRTCDEHFELGMQAMKKKEWKEAVFQFRVVTLNFPEDEKSKEALYFLGLSYFHAGDVDLANKRLSQYLELDTSSKHFEQAFRYKLHIADAFKNGARKHLFDQEKMPRVFAEEQEAVKIYDEIIAAFPSHDLGAKALISKASVQQAQRDYKGAQETYQIIIRKFPKRDVASESFLHIGSLFLEQARIEFQNPDFIQLAELNLKRFKKEFPKASPLHEKATVEIAEMKELFATGLYETGKLYERKGKPKAALLYYTQASKDFPQTQIAVQCNLKIKELQTHAKELSLDS